MRRIGAIAPFSLAFLFACAGHAGRAPAAINVATVVEQVARWETEGNAAAKRSSAPLAIEHYEIPLKFLSADFSARLDPALRAALIFERDGESYVRWIINHEDTKWHLEVEKWLVSKGLSTERHRYFKAYMTASRSYLLEDPQTHVVFSAKASTDVTGGAWKDKRVDAKDTREVRMMSEYIEDIQDRVQLERLRFLPEPMSLSIDEIDQALAVRAMGPVAEGESYLLPLFSALNNEVGREIAELNGSTDPKEFWRQHLVGPLAEAYAELTAHFGMTYDSPHGQNFLVELDAQKRPTGRIYFKDFGDAYLQTQHFRATGHEGILKNFHAANLSDPYELSVKIGLLFGNERPSWLSEADYRSYNEAFFSHFDRKFSELTGVPEALLKKTPLKNSTVAYAEKLYDVDMDWTPFLRNARCAQGLEVDPCPPALRQKMKIPHSHSATAGGCGIAVQSLVHAH